MTTLQYAIPKTRWVKFNGDTRIKDRALEAARKPGWNPKILNLSKYVKVIDYSFYHNSDEVHSFKVLLYKDSKHLRDLSEYSHLPKVIKKIYTRENLLAYARSKEAWPQFQDWDRAQEVWKTYQQFYKEGVLS